ncbi:hypothetical protein GOBAR_AA04622 [Gossypium barbadense]|uniref:Peroxisomal membrane protein PEX14 n=1 Tax=Gossypium barbadense TaxID=3634 RepID=A0A2P5YK45_GOSBA|nr:hypothetical protein GOBAR_AA04622 [Gossypium barbadense]
MREELVDMAVKFLLHPTVGRSPVSQRRLFLEKRGLSSEEIDEAFRRVSVSTLTFLLILLSTTYTVIVYPGVPDQKHILLDAYRLSRTDVQSKPLHGVQLQDTAQSSQPLVASILTASRPSWFSWSYAIFSIVLLIFSGVGTSMLLKNFLLPRLKSWICKVVFEEDNDKGRKSKLCLSKEAIKSAKAAATASVNAAKASLEILQSKKDEGRHLDDLLRRLGSHVAELRSMSITVQRLESDRNASHKNPEQYLQHTSQYGRNSNLLKMSVVQRGYPGPTKFKPSGISNFDNLVRPSSAPLRPPAGQYPKSYMEVLAKVQRGEKPPGIKDTDDSPPNPNQPLPNPHITPRLQLIFDYCLKSITLSYSTVALLEHPRSDDSVSSFSIQKFKPSPWEIAQPQNSFGYSRDRGFSQPNRENALPWWKRNNTNIRGVEAGNGSYGLRTDK